MGADGTGKAAIPQHQRLIFWDVTGQQVSDSSFFEHIELTPVVPFPLERHRDCDSQKG